MRRGGIPAKKVAEQKKAANAQNMSGSHGASQESLQQLGQMANDVNNLIELDEEAQQQLPDRRYANQRS